MRTLNTLQPVEWMWIAILLIACGGTGHASDWPIFRGPDQGISKDTAVPLTWNDKHNLLWKTPLPGPGTSSPIVAGDRVYVTCYSGYGVNPNQPGNKQDLTRHVTAIDRKTGEILASKAFKASMPEDDYRGYLREHGYASHTPTSDGQRLYVMFGKSGVFALNMELNKVLWRKSVGMGTASKRWGSAGSLMLYNDLLIVNASDESSALIALNKYDGNEAWRYESPKMEQAFGTPVIVTSAAGRDELVMGVVEAVGAFDPAKGTLLWRAMHPAGSNISASAVAYKDTVIINGGWPTKMSTAVRIGGSGDVSDSHVLWTKRRQASYVPTPILYGDHLYVIDEKGLAWCQDARTGQRVWEKTLDLPGRGMRCYASPLRIGDRIYAVTRYGGTVVFTATPDGYKQLAHNKLAADKSQFNGTPAISNGRLYLRSDTHLYCIAAK